MILRKAVIRTAKQQRVVADSCSHGIYLVHTRPLEPVHPSSRPYSVPAFEGNPLSGRAAALVVITPTVFLSAHTGFPNEVLPTLFMLVLGRSDGGQGTRLEVRPLARGR
eukprot:SAG31_NODE_1196_length_9445_cov_9.153970_10_plen_109_part_00